ncbi:MAG: hypothetical protein LUQ28_15190, partial [Methylococcaceae bacterium]|nr:hypothetical protein [Methylococcaceae bacterium]
KNGINTAITLNDGSIYMTLGGGYSVNGTSTEVVMDMLHKKRTLKAAEQQVKQYISENKSTFNLAEELVFSLGMNETSFFVTEISNQSTRYKLFDF